MEKRKPFVSIVIANYNYGKYLSSALNSIVNQDCDDYEIIVIDGGSTDNSIDIIKQYEPHIAYWISEPDGGQSNAFNKGFNKANGVFITWLNADDILLPGTISAVKNKLEANPIADWATGNFIRFIDSSKLISQAKWGPHRLPSWMQSPQKPIPVFGPTSFWRKSVYDKIGPIDESLNYTMDIEYWSRLVQHGYLQVRVNHDCWAFRMHEDSKTAEYGEHERSDAIKEKMRKELIYIKDKTGCEIRIGYKILAYIMRILDLSAFIALFRKFFVVGKRIDKYYELNYKL